MKIASLMMVVSAVLILSACADEKTVVQKSPCVGIDNSPCGPKRPINGKLNNMVENQRAQMLRA